MKPSSATPAETAGLRKSARGTRTSHPATAPAKRIAEILKPTMKPTPMTMGEASGVESRMPPAYSILLPTISMADLQKC